MSDDWKKKLLVMVLAVDSQVHIVKKVPPFTYRLPVFSSSA